MNYVKISLLGMCIFFFSSAINAQEDKIIQESQKAEVVLVNGHILVGELVEYIPDEKIVMRIGDGPEITFTMNQVKKIEMIKPKVKQIMPYVFKEKGWFNRTSVSAVTGESGTGYVVDHTVTYQYNNYLGIGLGAGISNYYQASGYNIFPVFMEV